MSHVDAHFEKLRTERAGARIEQGAMGTVVSVPNIALEPKEAWNKEVTTVCFVVPVGYPQAQPDCFWVDEDVRLRSGALPTNTAVNTQLGRPLLWFSWHLARWSPSKDDLRTYLRVIEARLRKPT